MQKHTPLELAVFKKNSTPKQADITQTSNHHNKKQPYKNPTTT